ncbi:hypothetical protein GYMLUDRAFT_247276 [Collybiopsis luxurians FD-317 M1]|uniref:Uncharacterized protein n=1 Tax=Collybiopsis luxurians FD-317 M1 TaxID=944289 RepID=A0A0D0CFZ0_9AGAR|nr:hypothetical protein GYMLUDRAFT_247276 [Collybiopsis luxurians FD-317 M1]
MLETRAEDSSCTSDWRISGSTLDALRNASGTEQVRAKLGWQDRLRLDQDIEDKSEGRKMRKARDEPDVSDVESHYSVDSDDDDAIFRDRKLFQPAKEAIPFYEIWIISLSQMCRFDEAFDMDTGKKSLHGIFSWPVAELLDWILGENHGIIYRRVELRELIAMHSSASAHGGDLKTDPVAIIVATPDLQEKIVSQARFSCFQLTRGSNFNLLKKIVESGHSRVLVYEEVDVPISLNVASGVVKKRSADPERTKDYQSSADAIPIRNLQLSRVPFIPQNGSLLGLLDKFQESRSRIFVPPTKFSWSPILISVIGYEAYSLSLILTKANTSYPALLAV